MQRDGRRAQDRILETVKARLGQKPLARVGSQRRLLPGVVDQWKVRTALGGSRRPGRPYRSKTKLFLGTKKRLGATGVQAELHEAISENP